MLVGTLLFAVTSSIQAQESAPQVAGSVTGRVTDADNGAPIVGAIVTLAHSLIIGPWEANFLTTRTDKDGDYRFENVADYCCYDISASAVGFVSQEYKHQGPLHIDPSTHLQGIDFRLMHEAVIRGTVVDENGRPVANLPVAALGPPQHRWELEHLGAWAKTDALGQFVIRGLPPGIYRVCANEIAWYNVSHRPPYREGWYRDSPSREGAIPIALKEGDERSGLRITVEPETRHQVVVRPSGPLGAKVPVRYEVTLERPHDMSIKQTYGNYSFPDLPPGRYSLTTTAWGPVQYLGKNEKVIDLTDSDITVHMRLGGPGEIAGTVKWTGASVEPAAKALFTIESEDGVIQEVRVNARAHFVVSKVIPGNYLFISSPDASAAPVPRDVQCSGKKVSDRSPLQIGDSQKVLDYVVTLANP